MKPLFVIPVFIFNFGCFGSIDLPCHLGSESRDFISSPTAEFVAVKAQTIQLDGCGNDSVWQSQTWFDLNSVWMGTAPVDSEDYRGRFKIAWDADALYILVEIIDDHLHETLSDGTDNYWKGDYVEVFLDEDHSGGPHQFSHQAFAYHVSTEGHAIDKGTAKQTLFLDDHVAVKRTREGNRYFWEMAVKVFDDSFDEALETNLPVVLTAGKKMGFSLAYGDNDGHAAREHFVGSKLTHGVNNDEGYTNSSVFGTLILE